MRVLLVWPRARTEPDWGDDLGAMAEPLALEYVGAIARDMGHDVQLLDLRLHPHKLDETLNQFQPDLVCITAYTMHVNAANAIAKQARDLIPECKVVVGGHHATFFPEDFYADGIIDYVVCGSGIQAFEDLLNSLNQGKQCSGVAGLWYKRKAKYVCDAPTPPYDLSQLPVPDRSLTGDSRGSYFIDWMKPVALLRTSVGCPFKCSFCSLWKLTGGKYIRRDIQSVVDELELISEPYIFLIDDEAFIDNRRMIEMAGAIDQRGIRKQYFAYCRIDTLLKNQDALKAWKSIGMERLLIGVDAIKPNDIDDYVKGYSVSQIEEAFQVAKDLNIELFTQFVVNTNYSKQDFVQLRRFIEHHRLPYPSFTVLTPLPGAGMMENFDSITEWQENGRPDWELFDTAHSVTETKLGKDQFRTEFRNLYKSFKGSYSQYGRSHLAIDDKGRTVVSG